MARKTQTDEVQFPEDLMDLQQWRHLLQVSLAHLPGGKPGKPRFRFRIVEIEPELIATECRDRSDTYLVEITADLQDAFLGAWCDCHSFRPGNPCQHLRPVVQYLCDQMVGPQSELMRAPDASPQSATQILAGVLQRCLDGATPPGSTGLSPADTELNTRLVWRLKDNYGLSLEPVLQQRKKRGNGWTKGRAASFSRLEEDPEVLADPLDQHILMHFASLNFYSRCEIEVNSLELLSSLAQHEHVLLNDASVRIEFRSFGLQVIQEDDFYHFHLDLGDIPPHRVSSWEYLQDGVIVVASSIPAVVGVRYSDPILHERLTRLVDSGDMMFPTSEVDQIRDQINSLSQVVSVRLPEALSHPETPCPGQLLLLLRARNNGSLDLGLRIRNAVQRLSEPGEGQLRYPGQQAGEHVMFVRDGEQEKTRARRIAGTLQLRDETARGDWEWQIEGLQTMLSLLDRAESLAADDQLELVWDESSVKQLGMAGSISPQNVRVDIHKDRDWFGVKGTFQVGDSEFQLQEVLEALQHRSEGGFVEILPGKWASITAEFRERLRQLNDVAHINRKKINIDITAAGTLQQLDDGQIELNATKAWQTCMRRLQKSQEINPTPAENFVGTLRDYQLAGYRWLSRLAEWGVGGCLADDMGLGKTVQVLALLNDRAADGPALVIAPTSVGFNWEQETIRFTPALTPHLYRDADRGQLLKDLGPGDVVIGSYGLAQRDAERLSSVSWHTLVLDEAQFIKNSRSKTATAIRNLTADWKVALTGTPMENHLGELWSLFRAISPGLFGSWERFRLQYAAPIEKDNDAERRRALSQLLQPFLLRRTKDEVLTELPERTETNLYVDLSKDERARYDEVRLAAVGELEEIEDLPTPQDQRFRILSLLTRLRQLACHRGLVDSSWTESSAKLDLLISTLLELRDEGHRVLVFSQFTQHLGLIRAACDAHNLTYQYLDGKTAAKTRKQRVQAFQDGQGDVFLISLKAGGTGLNLTAADYVIHMDPWWNPAVEDQATDRAHRMGQTRPVMVYRIIARGTIEEQILNLHQEKRDLVGNVLDGTQSAGGLSTTELAELIRSGDR